MSSGECHLCGCSEIDRDPARGDAVCTQCGSVLEDTIIVSEVQFAEDNHGGSRAIGQLVSAEGGTSGFYNLGFQHGMGKESRAITLQNAKRKISELAAQLHLNQRFVDMAYNFYKLALGRKLTKGRKNTHVVAACVYMACRKEETPHLSDILQVNVYELGKTYLRLSTALNISSPAIDPSLYILRFAHQLEFEDKTHEVSMTASRLVQRMKRDWMHTGRRPSGLCGAALLVAARLHNFSRTVNDVIKVVKVCHATVRKRLVEFGETPSSRLTLDEFMTIDLEEEQDPPAFKAARRKKTHQFDDQSKVEEVTKEISNVQKLIEKALEDTKKKSRGPYVKYSQFTPEEIPNKENAATSENVMTEQFIVEKTIESIKEVIKDRTECMLDIENKLSSAESQLNDILLPQPDADKPPILEPDIPLSSSLKGPGPTAASLGLKESIEQCMRIKTNKNESEEGGDLDLTGLDDAELDTYIMHEDEVKVKTDFWTTINADYLKDQKEKEERRAKEEEENANKPDQKKKRRRQKRTPIQASTAGEAIEKMLQQKKISCKINYDVLKSLNSENTPVESLEEKPCDGSPEMKEKLFQRTVKSRYKSKISQTAAVPSSIKKGMSAIIGNTRWRETSLPLEDDDQEIKSEPPNKIIKMSAQSSGAQEEIPSENLNKSQTETISNLMDQEPDEELEEENEEEDEVLHLSAAQLLDQHRGENELEYFEDQDDYYD